MHLITPCLWFDTQALAAAEFYVSLFKNSEIRKTVQYPAGNFPDGKPLPAGKVLTVDFTLSGQDFTGLNGGPDFSFTPALSLFVDCETRDELQYLQTALSAAGRADADGWLTDKYGLSWRLALTGRSQSIVPFLRFTGKACGRAESAMRDYCSLFPVSKIVSLEHGGAGNDASGKLLKFGTFLLGDRAMAAMDDCAVNPAPFNEAFSFNVRCQTQADIDAYWNKLTAGGEEGPCGWLKDRYGVSWQITGESFDAMLSDTEPAKAARVMAALFSMRKIDLQTLWNAYKG